jgi:hypothetical protein
MDITAGTRYYTPDFYIPEINTWIEIKGHAPCTDEVEKCVSLAKKGLSVVLIYGDVARASFYCWRPFATMADEKIPHWWAVESTTENDDIW